MPTIREALREARTRIDAIDARILLGHALQVSKEYLATHPDQALSPEFDSCFSSLVENRQQGRPVAYLIGKREFYGLEFEVTPDVLIPRPETELLVDLALERLPAAHPATVLDLGTGSGAIAIAIAFHRPSVELIAVDASSTALAVARANAARLLDSSRQSRLKFIESDWYASLSDERFDLILSNPPYIAGNDPHLGQGDLRFEPTTALTPGGDGLDAIRQIIDGSMDRLARGGWLLFEHGYDQDKACVDLLDKAGFKDVRTFIDLATLPRVTGGTLK